MARQRRVVGGAQIDAQSARGPGSRCASSDSTSSAADRAAPVRRVVQRDAIDRVDQRRLAASSASRRSSIGVGPACASMPCTVHVVPALPSAPCTTPIILSFVLEHRALLDVRLEVRADRMRAGFARVPDVADARQRVAPRSCRRVSRCASACSSVKAPANTPEPIITGTKREPSSLVQKATSIGASVSMPCVVQRAHAPRGRPARRSCRRTCRRSAACRCGCRSSPAAGVVAAGAAHEDVADRVDAHACSLPRFAQRTNRSRPWRSRSVSARRQTPPFAVAPICASSISEFHSAAPSTRRSRAVRRCDS